MNAVVIRAAIAAAATVLSMAHASAGDRDTDAVERVRAELTRRLGSADAASAVRLRSEDAPAPMSELRPAERPSSPGSCLVIDQLTDEYRSLGSEKPSSLHSRREALVSGVDADRASAEVALARAYLVLGFSEEARAIAAARSGAETAGIVGLSFLTEGDGPNAAAVIADHLDCGALYDFIAEAAGLLADEKSGLSGAAEEVLRTLPQPLRRSIADALSISALRTSLDSARGLLDAAGEQSLGLRSTADLIVEAASKERGDAKAVSTLTAISAVPGPHRDVALSTLSEKLGYDISPGLEADIEEAAGASHPPDSLASLNLTLAERRIARADFVGAARSLGSAHRNPKTRSAAGQTFSGMIQTLLRSENASARMAALQSTVAEPEIAASSLSANDLRSISGAIADLGAAQSLSKLLSLASIERKEKALVSSRALFRAGKIDEARALAGPYSSDPRFAELLLTRVFDASEAPSWPDVVDGASVDPRVLAGAIWRAGDLQSLRALLIDPRGNESVAKKIVLAHLAGRTPPPAAVLAATADLEGSTALFATLPNLKELDARTLSRYAAQQKSAIAYLRGAIGDE